MISRLFAPLFLCFSLLLSSTGFTAYERLCSVAGRDFSLTADHGACCKGHQHTAQSSMGSCCKSKKHSAPVSLDASRCCTFNAMLFQSGGGVAPVEFELPQLSPLLFKVPVVNIHFTSLLSPGKCNFGMERSLVPVSGMQARVRMQSFIC